MGNASWVIDGATHHITSMKMIRMSMLAITMVMDNHVDMTMEVQAHIIIRMAAMRTVITVPQSVDYMDPAMKLTERLVLAKTLEHDGNPAMAWMISNVVVERNYKDKIYPRKAGGKDSPNKIDGPVAMFTALSQAMRMSEPAPHFQILRLGGR